MSSILLLALALAQKRAWGADLGQLKTVWNAATPEKSLAPLRIDDLRHLGQQRAREKNPATGVTKTWHGPLMSVVVEKAMASLSNAEKAQVDLIVLRSASGLEAQVPRWLITKYPVILALEKGSFRLVLPYSSRPGIRKEGLPLGNYALTDIVEIDLSRYARNYGPLFLKRRMDPVALRGEKLFVENCTSCHAAGIGEGANPVGAAAASAQGGRPISMAELTGDGKARRLASGGHPAVKNLPTLSSHELRALGSYLRAFRLENPVITNHREAVPSSSAADFSAAPYGQAAIRPPSIGKVSSTESEDVPAGTIAPGRK